MNVPVHRLSVVEFDELAVGRGGTAGELLAGQLSKRLLQVLAVLSETARRHPDIYADGGLAESYAELAAARQQSKAAVDAVLLHPLVGAWVSHTLRRLMSHGDGGVALEDDLGHFGAIAAVAAIAAGRHFELTMRVRADGTLMVPTFGVARPGPVARWGARWCRARWRPGIDIELCLDDVEATVPVGSTDLRPDWSPVRKVSSVVAGCRLDVELDDVDPYRDCHGLGAADRLPQAAVARWQSCLDEAWELLVRRHRALAQPLASGVAVLVPLDHKDRVAELGRVTGVSATVSDACGAVALTEPPDGAALAATLVHEFQHSKLSALLDLVPLHRADLQTVFYAPWRADPRPLHGLLHGAYAHLALVDLWQDLRWTHTGSLQRMAHFEFTRWRRVLRQVLRTLQASGLLTPAGERFVDQMCRRLAQLPANGVPPEIEALARQAMLDHWLTWRLRNLRPDPEWLVTAGTAWLAGERCPPVPPSSAVVGGAVAAADARLELTYRRLEATQHCAGGPDLGAGLGSVIDADVSLVGDDPVSAARQYREALTAAPDRADWWVGLALAHRQLGTPVARALTARLEYVYGLHRHLRAVTGMAPDVLVLADWAVAGSTHDEHFSVASSAR